MQPLVELRAVQYCRDLGVPPENVGSVLIIVQALHQSDTKILDIIDDYNSSRRALLFYEDLVHRGLLERGKEGDHYCLTERGLELAYLITVKPREMVNVAEEQQAAVDDVGRIMQFMEQRWPSQDGTGRLLRTGKEAATKKMVIFLSKHTYTVDTILEAIERYVAHKEAQGRKYMHSIQYFIYKTENVDGKQVTNSVLQDWCEEVIDNANQQIIAPVWERML